MNRHFRFILYTAVGAFALIGLFFTIVFAGMQFGLFNVRGSIAERNTFFAPQKNVGVGINAPCVDRTLSTCVWTQTPEWEVIQGGLGKDAAIITAVSEKTGVSSRLIAAVVVPEQTRFFTSEREVFKRYFEPLKILGSLSQFSLGVSGIKQETAVSIEELAGSTTSPFYPGDGMARLLAYEPGVQHDAVLYARLTDAKNHYYSYLYTALFIKEVEAQWKAAGYDISKNPGAVVTLFNIGFKKSHPNPSPSVAGSTIETGGKKYSYGELGANFYNSTELTDIFPK